MSKEKTILEWLEELPDGYRERALANMDPDLGNINICKDLPEATSRAFVWEKTPEEEGYDFWCAVYDWAEGNGDLPPLPEGGIMKEERLVTRKEVGKLILIRLKGRIEEVVVRTVSPNEKFMKVNIGHENAWLAVGDYPILDILPDTKWVLDLCGLPEDK